MATDELLTEREGSVLIVTFNREHRLNSLNDRIHAALPELWQDVKKDNSVRAIVITGKGRAFCTGMDLKENAARGRHRDNPGGESYKEGIKMTPMQNDVWLPVISAVNGLCVAGGFHFISEADVVIASTEATFFDTHAMIGQVSALEPIGLLPRIGLGNVLRMVALGKAGRLNAQDALRISLVDEVVEPDQLMPRAMELAFAAAQASPVTLELSKKVIWESLELPMSEALQHGLDVLRAHRSHPDCREGPLAFAEKRQPRWIVDATEGMGSGA